jgi:hypothetical protein
MINKISMRLCDDNCPKDEMFDIGGVINVCKNHVEVVRANLRKLLMGTGDDNR